MTESVVLFMLIQLLADVSPILRFKRRTQMLFYKTCFAPQASLWAFHSAYHIISPVFLSMRFLPDHRLTCPRGGSAKVNVGVIFKRLPFGLTQPSLEFSTQTLLVASSR